MPATKLVSSDTNIVHTLEIYKKFIFQGASKLDQIIHYLVDNFVTA